MAASAVVTYSPKASGFGCHLCPVSSALLIFVATWRTDPGAHRVQPFCQSPSIPLPWPRYANLRPSRVGVDTRVITEPWAPHLFFWWYPFVINTLHIILKARQSWSRELQGNPICIAPLAQAHSAAVWFSGEGLLLCCRNNVFLSTASTPRTTSSVLSFLWTKCLALR